MKNNISTKKSGLILVLFSFTSLMVSQPALAENTEPNIVPKLRTWTGGVGSITLTSSATQIYIDSAEANISKNGQQQDLLVSQSVKAVADKFKADLNAQEKLLISVSSVSNPIASAGAADIIFDLDTSIDNIYGAEGYTITMTDNIVIKAKTSTGLFYGTRTLLQMLKLDSGASITKGTIGDYPGQQGRMIMLDAGRKYWGIPYIKDLIREMSWVKSNAIFFHFAESEGFRLQSPNFSELNMPDDLSYNQSEVAEIIAFAKEHHVIVIPGFEFPGHASALSAAFNIGFDSGGSDKCTQSHMRNTHITPSFVVDMTSTVARNKVKDMLNEFIPWFTSPYVHIGADEVDRGLASCPRVANYISANANIGSFGDLMTEFTNDLNTTVKENGKKTLMYDGLDHMSTPYQDLDSDIIFTLWEGTNPPAGHQYFVLNPTHILYVTPNNYHNVLANVNTLYTSWTPDVSPLSLGSGVSVWADYNFDAEDEFFEDYLKPRRDAYGSRSWNTDARIDTLGDFQARFSALGNAPGYIGFTTPTRVNNGEPTNRYTFDDIAYPEGWFWAGSSGQTIWAEDTKNNLHGSSYIINNPTIGSGKVGGSFVMNSDGDGIGFGGVDMTPPWTMAVWVKKTDSLDESILLSSDVAAIKLEQWNSGSKVGFTENGVSDHSFDYGVPMNTWTHITLSASTSETKLYVNGIYNSSIAHVINLPRKALGRPGKFMRGELDELSIFDEELSSTQIIALHKVSTPKYRFNFDEGSGTTINDAMHSAVTGNFGSGIAAPKFVESLRPTGKALAFDGNDEIILTNMPTINGDWTLSAWVFSESNLSSATLAAGSSGGIRVGQYGDPTKVGFTSFGIADYTSSYSLPLNTWTFLTMVRTGLTIQVYANGILQSTMPNTGHDMDFNRLGSTNPGGSGTSSDFFKGKMDDLIIFDVALNADEVQMTYNMESQ